MPQEASNKTIFVFDHPRSCSNLFAKILSPHPQLTHILHPYLLPACFGPERITPNLDITAATWARREEWFKTWDQEKLAAWRKVTYAQGQEEVEGKVKRAEEEGKVAMMQEHTAICLNFDTILSGLRGKDENASKKANPTCMPDHFLDNITPVFLIRHPALAIPSFCRTSLKASTMTVDDEDFKWWTHLQWSKILYEFFSARGQAPFLIDAEDLIHNSSATLEKLCAHLGISFEGVQLNWEPEKQSHGLTDAVPEAWVDKLQRSKGIERDEKHLPDADLDVENCAEQWKEEFGEHVAGKLRQRALEEMETYWYLRSKRVR